VTEWPNEGPRSWMHILSWPAVPSALPVREHHYTISGGASRRAWAKKMRGGSETHRAQVYGKL